MSSETASITPAPIIDMKKQEKAVVNNGKPLVCNAKTRKKEKKALKVRVKKDTPKIESHWDELPDLLLEQIFSYLTIRERFQASQVCQTWYDAFYLPKVWSTFVLSDSTLVRRKFNYYMGWQYVLDHMRTQNCLATVGRNIRNLIFEPMFNFYNLYEFMVMLSYYAERNEEEKLGKVVYHRGNIVPILVDVRGGGKGIGSRISTLRFTFPCNMAQSHRAEDEYVFGTGGRLLEAFKRLMGSLGPTLRHLELTDLLLERYEALKLLDDVCASGCETLQSLSLINVTKVPCQLLHAGIFINLQVLVLSPQTLGPDLLQLLGDCSQLRHLHLVQNRYTPENLASAAWKCWRSCRRANTQLSVHLSLENVREGDVVWQQCAPVRSILYKSPYLRVTTTSVLTAIDQYRSDLEVYGHIGIPRFYRPSTFHERGDSLLLLLCRQCPSLHTLIIRERVSTSTILLLAYTGHNLRFLHVRRNAIILRCDWPRSPEWSETFYTWLKNASKSYEATEREVSQILGYHWTMLSDRQFKLTNINLHQSPYYQSCNRASYHTYIPPPPPISESTLDSNIKPPQAKRERNMKKKVKNNINIVEQVVNNNAV